MMSVKEYFLRRAPIIALAAFAMGAMMNVGVKALDSTVPLIQILVARFALGLIVLIPNIRAEGGIYSIWNAPARKGLLISRAILGLLAVGLSFYGFTHLPLAPATVLWKTGPLLVMLLAGPILGETTTLRQWLAGGLGFSGTVVMMLQSGGDIEWEPAVIMLLGAICAAISNLQVRTLTQTVSPTVVIVWYFTLALIPCLIAFPWVAVMPNLSQAGLLLWVGLAGCLMMILNTTAYKLLMPATVAVYEYTALFWATLFGWLIWGEWPTVETWIGISMIIMGSLLTHKGGIVKPLFQRKSQIVS